MTEFICPKCFLDCVNKHSLIEHSQSHLKSYTQIKIKSEYREKLSKLATSQSRSMANMVEVLIDQATGLSGEHNASKIASPNLTQRKEL